MIDREDLRMPPGGGLPWQRRLVTVLMAVVAVFVGVTAVSLARRGIGLAWLGFVVVALVFSLAAGAGLARPRQEPPQE